MHTKADARVAVLKMEPLSVTILRDRTLLQQYQAAEKVFSR
jgi:hypothetical protein